MKSGESGPELVQAVEFDPATAPWQWWRAQMPIAPEWAYFDHAAVAPLSAPACRSIGEFADQASTLGDTVWPSWAARIEHLRGLVAKLLRCETSEIYMVPNTTAGINVVAEGWPWQPGDSVVLPDGEFPSNLFPWQNQRSRGVETRIVPRRSGGEVRVQDLIDQVDQTTRMIAVSWVGYASGYRIDLDSLVRQAHERGVLVFLDAIQGLGVFPLDLSKTPVDFLAADGHKWMLGPEGAGVAMIRKPHLEKLRCGSVGWGSVKNSHNYASPSFDLRNEAARFEAGSANMVGTTALAASLEMFQTIIQHHGPQAIGERVIARTDMLDQKLREKGVITRRPAAHQNRSGILTFEVPGVEPAAFRKRALQEKVVVSCRDGGVRASVHVYNDDADITRLVDLV